MLSSKTRESLLNLKNQAGFSLDTTLGKSVQAKPKIGASQCQKKWEVPICYQKGKTRIRARDGHSRKAGNRKRARILSQGVGQSLVDSSCAFRSRRRLDHAARCGLHSPTVHQFPFIPRRATTAPFNPVSAPSAASGRRNAPHSAACPLQGFVSSNFFQSLGQPDFNN